MTLDEHPEELIDLALAGGLAAADRATLDRHLMSCRACAAQLAHAHTFEADSAAQPRDANLDRRAIEAALGRVVSATRRARPRVGWWRWAAAGVLLTLGTAGAALLVRPASSPTPPAVVRCRPRLPATAPCQPAVPSPLPSVEPETPGAQPHASAAVRRRRPPRCSSAAASCAGEASATRPSLSIDGCSIFTRARARRGCRSRSPGG